MTLEEFSLKFGPILNTALQIRSLNSMGCFRKIEVDIGYICLDYFLDTINSIFIDVYTDMGRDWLAHVLCYRTRNIETCYSCHLEKLVSIKSIKDIYEFMQQYVK